MSLTLDAKLLAASRGDEMAFLAVYDALSRRAYGLAVRILEDPERAQTEVREAFCQAWRHSSSFDPATGSADAWVLAIVHRRVVDAVRLVPTRRGPRARATPGPEHRSTPAPPNDARTANDVWARVSPAQREVIELAYLDGQSSRELSQRLDLRLVVLSRLLREGLGRLGAAMGPPLAGV